MRSIRIAFFGKGGIGKTTIAANFSAYIASLGKKVLVVGCDPKMDSTKLLMGKEFISPFMEKMNPHSTKNDIISNIYKSPIIKNLDCIEVGGPKPGVGCAGVGIGMMIDMLGKYSIADEYDFVIFDVLGDIVCGGFAGPLRSGFADIMIIVTSDEISSLYAANRLISMAQKYKENGIKRVCLIANLKEGGDVKKITAFSELCNVDVISTINYDIKVRTLSDKNKLAVFFLKESGFYREIKRIYNEVSNRKIKNIDFKSLDSSTFTELSINNFEVLSNKVHQLKENFFNYSSIDEVVKKNKISFRGIYAEGQLLFSFNYGFQKISFIIMSYSVSKGKLDYKDWFICFSPGTPYNQQIRFSEKLNEIKKSFSNFKYEEIEKHFIGNKMHFRKNLEKDNISVKIISSRPLTVGEKWHKFIYTEGFTKIFIPPGVVIIEHGDIECKFSDGVGGNLGMFCKKDIQFPSMPKWMVRILNDEIDDNDIIYGDEEKIKSCIKTVPGFRKKGLIEIYNCCTPLLTAADKSSISKLKSVYMENLNSFNENTSYEKIEKRIKYMLDRIKIIDKKDRYDFNFINFNFNDEISKYLKSAKVRFIETGEHTDEFVFYSAIKGSKWQILFNDDLVLKGCFEKAGINYKIFPPPFGLKNSINLLKNLSLLSDRNIMDFVTAEKEIIKELFSLKKDNKNIKIGIIINVNELQAFLVNKIGKEIPIFDFLSEAGFDINMFLYLDQSKSSDILKLPRKENLKIIFFKDPKELSSVLLKSKVRLVYSDVRTDRRLIELGITPFSEDIFEMGIEGFFETIKRIRRLNEWKFYEKYAGYKYKGKN
ncbi:MAG: AAA family ATPase [Elusimicrobiota bacterium]